MPQKLKDLAGKTFGRLTVLCPATRAPNGEQLWACRCTCGKERRVTGGNLRNGSTRSCGCLRSETTAATMRTHGDSRSAEYVVWLGLVQRCTKPRAKAYKYYGARGICVDERWLGEEGYTRFLADMGRKPTTAHTLERRENDGPYSKENCVWATRREQANNRRSNRVITFRDETRTLAAWERYFGSGRVLSSRLLRGWSVERTFTTPVRRVS